MIPRSHRISQGTTSVDAKDGEPIGCPADDDDDVVIVSPHKQPQLPDETEDPIEPATLLAERTMLNIIQDAQPGVQEPACEKVNATLHLQQAVSDLGAPDKEHQEAVLKLEEPDQNKEAELEQNKSAESTLDGSPCFTPSSQQPPQSQVQPDNPNAEPSQISNELLTTSGFPSQPADKPADKPQLLQKSDGARSGADDHDDDGHEAKVSKDRGTFKEPRLSVFSMTLVMSHIYIYS